MLRGYKTSEVDWVLDRLGAELDQLRGELSAVRAAAGLDEPYTPTTPRLLPTRNRCDGTVPDDGRTRCGWRKVAAVPRDYHDDEWGRVLRGECALFERMSLEAFQSACRG